MLYALSQVIGDGTMRIVPGSENTTGPFRPRATIYGAFVAVIPPGQAWCLVKLVGADESAGSPVRSDGGLIVLPPPGHTWTSQEINLGNLRLTQEGFPALLTVGMTTEDAVNAVGNYMSPGWSLDLPFSVNGE
jgi:hypothetical protein